MASGTIRQRLCLAVHCLRGDKTAPLPCGSTAFAAIRQRLCLVVPPAVLLRRSPHASEHCVPQRSAPHAHARHSHLSSAAIHQGKGGRGHEAKREEEKVE